MGILDGKAAVVTGGGRGVGRGHCLHLAREGAAVVVNDVDADESRKVVGEIKAAGGRAVASGADIGTRKGAQELVAQCVDEFGGIHAVVNNAGIVRDKSFLKMTDDEWELVLRIHAGGTFWCAQEGAIRMRDQGSGGAIVNTVSAAQMGNFGQTNYSAAKGAIASMTYTWANELARYGIRVNAISPMATTRMSATFKGADGKEVAGPFFDPTLNGPIVAYLCSDEGSWITGQVFGTGGDRVVIMKHPVYDTGMFKPGGWDVAALREHMPKFFKGRLEPVGLYKKPYPYYDGVKPESKG
ncbi:MAG TPA: SDR family NAD(P)-dependent oxidoreductase [Myxococcota bacterium]|nr:SDR family NAD(P)-dependent oxidoreductase [Myxococcota bacterium]